MVCPPQCSGNRRLRRLSGIPPSSTQTVFFWIEREDFRNGFAGRSHLVDFSLFVLEFDVPVFEVFQFGIEWQEDFHEDSDQILPAYWNNYPVDSKVHELFHLNTFLAKHKTEAPDKNSKTTEKNTSNTQRQKVRFRSRNE